MDPSSADHRVATLNTGGVVDEPLSATNFTVKSRVMRARSITATASTAAAAMRNVSWRAWRSPDRIRPTRPSAVTTRPMRAAPSPAATAAEPSATLLTALRFSWDAVMAARWSGRLR